MVSFSNAVLLSLAAVGTLAAPTIEKRNLNDKHCMNPGQAQQVVDNYANLIKHPKAIKLAHEALAVDFTDYSESVNTLIDTCPQGAAAVYLPLLTPTFPNRKDFIIGQGQQQPINFIQKGIWNTCNTAIVRWETTDTVTVAPVRPVVGVIILEVVEAPAGSKYPWLISEVFSEFDSGAWLQNLEQAGVPCGADTSAPAVVEPVTSTAVTPVASSTPVVSSSPVVVVSSAVATTTDVVYTTASTTVYASSAAATASAYSS